MSHLTVAGAKRLRQRAVSDSERWERYSSMGGLVDVQLLAKRYETDKWQRWGKKNMASRHSAAFRAGSESSSTSSAEGREGVSHSLPLSPWRSEGWQTPETPQTPMTPCKRETSPSVCHYYTISSPPVSKFSRFRRCAQAPHFTSTYECFPAPKHRALDPIDSLSLPLLPSKFDGPLELPGSLLLPSQGFVQSDPPVVPPRDEDTRQTFTLPSTPHQRIITCSMTEKPPRQGDQEYVKANIQQNRCAPPPRLSSLPPNGMPPLQPPPPIPLSQMTMEDLMQILPKLDAAVIAHDWVPCMQTRQRELKQWLQKGIFSFDRTEGAQSLERDLRKIVNELKDIGKTYYYLFEIARELQNEDLQKKANEIDEAYAQRSEAVLALARHVSMHNEKCDQYEREMVEFKDKTAQSMDTLSTFIHENLNEAMLKAPHEQIQNVLNVLVESQSSGNYSSIHVHADLYGEVCQALQKSNHERDGLRDVCNQQMATIKEQSAELDQYVARMAKIIGIVRDKEREISDLRSKVGELTRQNAEQAKAAQSDQRQQIDPDVVSPSVDNTSASDIAFIDSLWVRDAEIANLRRKLDKAYNRESELQGQIRQLLQASQMERSEKPAAKFKRLLTGQHKSSPSIPTPISMHNLGHSVIAPFSKEKPYAQQSPSPPQDGRSSPTFQRFCEPTSNNDKFELPSPAPRNRRDNSSPQSSARLLGMVPYHKDDEIDSAVSSRFYQRPVNVRSIGPISQPDTPGSSRTPSYDQVSEYARSQPRFSSDPGFPEASIGSLRQGNVNVDRQPLIGAQRALSGITEVTEEGGSTKRKSSSPDSTDKRMYLDSMYAANALSCLQTT